MTFNDALRLIDDGNKYRYLRVFDTEGKRILDLDADNNLLLRERLEQYRTILSTYGKVKIQIATESIYKQNWKDAFNWNVTFNESATQTPAINVPTLGGPPAGYVSSNEALLMAQIAGLNKQMEFQLEMQKLRNEMSAMKNGGGSFDKYLPMLGMFMDLDETKIKNMMLLSSMNGGGFSQQHNTGINGPPQQNSVAGTDEEKQTIENINKQLELLAEKVHAKSIEQFLVVLNQKPEFLNTLIQMAQNFK